MGSDSISRTTIAALPGWYIAMFIRGDPQGTPEPWDDYLSLVPIVAWEIERSESRYDRHVRHFVIPITTEGNMNRSANLWAIKTPDGQYQTVDACFRTEADAIEYFRQRHVKTVA
jgi:hypothetical protein